MDILRPETLSGNKRGVALFVALALLAVLVITGAFIVKMTGTDIMISSNNKYDKQSFFAAEAGVSRARNNLNTVSGWLASLSQPETVNVFAGENILGAGISYHVTVFDGDPSAGKIRISSTGYVTNNVGTLSTSRVDVVVERSSEPYEIFGYSSFSCGSLELEIGSGSWVTGGDVYSNGNIEISVSGGISGGDVYSKGNIEVKDASSIVGGDAFADGNITVTSTADPNIGGDATVGGNIVGSGNITGTQTSGAPVPVVSDLCVGSSLSGSTLTAAVIQSLRDEAAAAGQKIDADYTYNTADDYTGVVHVTGNFTLAADSTFSANVIYVIDGNAENIEGSLTSSPAGSTATFIVPTGNFGVKANSGALTIDGAVLVGTVDADGSNISGGNVEVGDGTDLVINGSGITSLNGNTEGDFTVNHQQPIDPHLLTTTGTYTVTSWREL